MSFAKLIHRRHFILFGVLLLIGFYCFGLLPFMGPVPCFEVNQSLIATRTPATLLAVTWTNNSGQANYQVTAQKSGLTVILQETLVSSMPGHPSATHRTITLPVPWPRTITLAQGFSPKELSWLSHTTVTVRRVIRPRHRCSFGQVGDDFADVQARLASVGAQPQYGTDLPPETAPMDWVDKNGITNFCRQPTLTTYPAEEYLLPDGRRVFLDVRGNGVAYIRVSWGP